MTRIKAKAPVLLLGGSVTALSLMRSFGRREIKVCAVMNRNSCAAVSKYCHRFIPIPESQKAEEFFAELTLSGADSELDGSVIFSCGDDAVGFVAANHGELSKRFILERNDPRLQLDLLDKEKTLAIAASAGLSIPRYRHAESTDDIRAVLGSLEYPVMLKPRLTYLLYRLSRRKYCLAMNDSELLDMSKKLFDHDIAFTVCEMIPGPDSLSCSYYTYRLPDGTELLSLTKRCIRRRPLNEGSGTYQITDYAPDVELQGKKFFNHIDYHGIGSIEFKRDKRDGKLKVMECNNRFTAVQEQLVQCGADAAVLAYADLTGQQTNPIGHYRAGVAIWSPLHDFSAFREVRRADPEASWFDWPRSMNHSKVVFPFFSWRDPAPFFLAMWQQVARLLQRTSKHD